MDDISRKVWLIDSNNKIYREINPDIPGFSWSPAFVSLNKDGYVFVISAPFSNHLFIFNSNGLFVKKLILDEVLKLSAIRNIVSSSTNDLYISFTRADLNFGILKVNFKNEYKEINSSKILFLNNVDYPNIVSSQHGSISCVIDNNNNIYQAFITSPNIYKYSNDFNLVSKFRREPQKYHKLERDLKNRREGMGPNFKKVQKMLTEYTHLDNLFYLECGIIVIQYYGIDIKGTLLDFLNLEDKYITKGNIISPYRIVAASVNSIFFVEQPTELDKDGNFPNPKIIEYEINKLILKKNVL